METFNVEVGRTRTATGWEWFLLVDGKRVPMTQSGVGVFTSLETNPEPAEMLPRLLARALARRDSRK